MDVLLIDGMALATDPAHSETITIPKDKWTWFENHMNGTIQGFLMDTKAENRTIRGSKQAGLRLYVKTLTNTRLSFFIPHDPYFYVIPDPNVFDDVKQKVIDLKNLEETDGCKNVHDVDDYLFDLGDGCYIGDNIWKALKVTIVNPRDVPIYADACKKIDGVIGCREYTIPFKHRAGLDLDLNVGKAYAFSVQNNVVIRHVWLSHIDTLPQITCFAFDIEIFKKAVKKPQDDDPVSVIAYCANDTGIILNNVELIMHKFSGQVIIGADEKKIVRPLEELDLTNPKLKYKPTTWKIIDCTNEQTLLQRFYSDVEKGGSDCYGGFNSDNFDWPHLATRGKIYGIKFEKIFYHDNFEGRGTRGENFIGDFRRNGTFMIDVYDWVRRDSYLSKGNQGLKSASRELLGINAMETDHELQVKIWKKMKDIWLNGDISSAELIEEWPRTRSFLSLPETNKYELIDDIRKRFSTLARDEAFRYLTYCASDVYVTYIFMTRSVVDFNIAVATMIPMNMDEVSRKTRGPMCELELIKGLRGWALAPEKVMTKRRNNINPVQIRKEFGSVFKEIKVKQNKCLAQCLSKKGMEKHCVGCTESSCISNWQRNWAAEHDAQKSIICSRDSEGITNDEEKIYFYPLENTELPVFEEKFQGAKVVCFAPGIYKDNAPMYFILDVKQVAALKDYFMQALENSFISIEKDAQKVKESEAKVKVRIINKDQLRELVNERFLKLLGAIQKKIIDGKEYDVWYGTPILIHVDVASMYPNVIINYNLQSHGIVSNEKCESCRFRYNAEKGEAPCWLDLKWNAVYVSVNASPEVIEKARIEVERAIEEDEVDEEDIEELYKKAIPGGKKYATFQFPVTTRFCQKKAHKYFVNTVRRFRDGRYKWKYAMQDDEDVIDKMKEQFRADFHYAMLRKIESASKTGNKKDIENIVKQLKGAEMHEKVAAVYRDLLSIFASTTSVDYIWLKNRLDEIKGEFSEKEMPTEVRQTINKLEMHRVLCRNMQLGLKVILNSLYGYLKSIGARFWAIEVTGCTTFGGQQIITFAVSFFSPIGKNIELDTDGIWAAFPSLYPLSVDAVIEYTVDGKTYTKEQEINLLNTTFNTLVKKEFTNHSNYVPCDSDGVIRNIYGDPCKYTDLDRFDYERDKKWLSNPSWVCIPSCDIKFDYEGGKTGYATIFVYTKKRMFATSRDPQNPMVQEVKTLTGLDIKRKGELKLIQTFGQELIDLYKNSNTIEECYKFGSERANYYLDLLRTHKLPVEMVLESRDISEDTAPKVRRCYKRYTEFLSTQGISADEFPIFSHQIESFCKRHARFEQRWFDKKEGIIPVIGRSPYAMTAFRTIDLGIPLENNDTVQWILTQYPAWKDGDKIEKEAKSQRAIPTVLFSATSDEIRMYLRRWFGNDPYTTDIEYDNVDISHYIDWNHYEEKFVGMLDRYLITPAKAQGFDVYQWLHVKPHKSVKGSKKEQMLAKNTKLGDYDNPLSIVLKKKKKKKTVTP